MLLTIATLDDILYLRKSKTPNWHSLFLKLFGLLDSIGIIKDIIILFLILLLVAFLYLVVNPFAFKYMPHFHDALLYCLYFASFLVVFMLLLQLWFGFPCVIVNFINSFRLVTLGYHMTSRVVKSKTFKWIISSIILSLLYYYSIYFDFLYAHSSVAVLLLLGIFTSWRELKIIAPLYSILAAVISIGCALCFIIFGMGEERHEINDN